MGKLTRINGGKFAPGNAGGPGRPPRQTEREYLKAMMRSCTPADWQDIIKRAVADAKKGDAKARDWLASYLVGLPKNEAMTPTALTIEEESGIDPLAESVITTKILGG